MNQQTKSPNRQVSTVTSTGTNDQSVGLHPNTYRLNILLFQNQDKSPPGRWRRLGSRHRLNPDWNSNRQWQQNQL